MNIALFAGLKTDRAYSMVKYTAGLMEAFSSTLETQFPGCSLQLYHGPGIRLPGVLGHSRRLSALANEGPATHVLYPRQARRQQADINHILDHSYGSLVAGLPPERTIVTCHDLIPLEVPDIHPTLYSQLTGRRWYKQSIAAMTKAARIIAISKHTKEDLVKHTSYDPDRINVIPHGIDSHYEPAADQVHRSDIRHSLGVSESCKLLLHVGNVAPYKNLHVLLKVFAHVCGTLREKAYLLRVGPLFTADQYRLLKQLNLDGQVIHKEGLSIEDMAGIFNAADVLVFPSLYEGLGLPVAEAMACGLPVVTSNAASIPEVLGVGQFTFDPADVEGMAEAVVAILENPSLRQKLVERGLRQAQRFSWPRVAEQVLAVYEDVWKEANERM